MKITFANGWFAEYSGDGKWALFDKSGFLRAVSYLDYLKNRFNLNRVAL